MSKLVKIVHKIANYVPWQNEGLTEDEFKVLDQANGVELAEIAYNNRINFNKFLINADKIIDMYNENLVWTQIKEVRALKRCLINSGTFSTSKPVITEKPKQIQSETVQNDDNVVPQMELPQNSPEHARNVIEELPAENRLNETESAQTVPHTRTFVSSLLAETSGLSRSIPMHRNIVRDTRDITLHQQNAIPNIDNLLDNDEMPILNEMEMAKMGIFDGIAGKKISKVFHQKSAAPLPNLSIDADIGPRNLQPLDIDVNPPSVDNVDNLLFTPDGDHYDAADLSPLGPEMQQIQPPTINEHQPAPIIVEQINPENIPIPIAPAEPTQNEIENEAEMTQNGRDSMSQRADLFRNAVDAFEGFLGRARRVMRKGNRQQIRQKQLPRQEDTLTMLKLRKEVQIKSKRKKNIQSMKQIKLPTLNFDFFNDIEVFIANDLPFEDIEAEVPQQRRESDFNLEFDPVTAHHRVATSTPMVPAQKNKRLNSSPEHIDQQPKRTRLDTIEDVRNLLNSLPDATENMQPIVEVPQESADIEAPPLITSKSVQQPAQPTSFSVPQLPQLDPSLSIRKIHQESIPPTELDVPSPQPDLELPQIDDNEPLMPPSPVQRESLPAVPELSELEINMALPVAESSREQSIPQMRRQSRLDILQSLHITPDSIDYDRLRRNSKLRKAPTDSRIQILPEEIFQNACENISEREAAKFKSTLSNTIAESPMKVPEVIPPAPKQAAVRKPSKDKFNGLPRIMMKGELHVELKSNDGSKKIYYTEHQLSCMTLYFKIRFLMREVRGTQPWKMTIKELFQQLKDLKESKVVTYQQIKHMTQIKLLNGVWSDEDELLEIEIPIDRIEETSDKENAPLRRRVSTRQALSLRNT